MIVLEHVAAQLKSTLTITNKEAMARAISLRITQVKRQALEAR